MSLNGWKNGDIFRLDSEIAAIIKLRYKDTSKHVIWRDCALPEEYNRSCLTLNSDHSKDIAIRYIYAGNHQATILRVKDDGAHRKQQLFYTVYPARTLPSESLPGIKKEKQTKLAASLNPVSKTSEAVVDIEDDRTPILKRIINSVRRSESSDENESIVNLTSPQVENESGFCEDDVTGHGNVEPDLQIWRL
ncbi:hypothetical protein DINM_002526 [Dirofilaria immitis]|nr:hypothetical protein [Dirofilaria immitis]